MNIDNGQIEGDPIIEADLGDNGGNVTFQTLEEAKRWVHREIRAWERRGIQTIQSPVAPYILEQRLRLPRAISESLQKAEEAQGDELLAALESIKEQFEQYVDYYSLCSTSEIGEEIFVMVQRNQPLLAIGVLASNLGIPVNQLLRRGHPKEVDLSVVLSGYALCNTSNLVRRSDLPEHKYRMELHLRRLDDIVKWAREGQRELMGSTENVVGESSQALKKEQSDWITFSDTAQREWDTLRNTFESQLRLEAPVKYWQDRADATSKVAKQSLFAFSAIAIAIIGVLVVFGPEFLERVSAMDNVGPFTTLVFVSIPALTALWGLKHVARLFVLNIERSSDARLRETMTTTFLALVKEGAATVDQDERLLILEALFRPPALAPSDDGHWGGLSALLSRRNS